MINLEQFHFWRAKRSKTFRALFFGRKFCKKKIFRKAERKCSDSLRIREYSKQRNTPFSWILNTIVRRSKWSNDSLVNCVTPRVFGHAPLLTVCRFAQLIDPPRRTHPRMKSNHCYSRWREGKRANHIGKFLSAILSAEKLFSLAFRLRAESRNRSHTCRRESKWSEESIIPATRTLPVLICKSFRKLFDHPCQNWPPPLLLRKQTCKRNPDP